MHKMYDFRLYVPVISRIPTCSMHDTWARECDGTGARRHDMSVPAPLHLTPNSLLLDATLLAREILRRRTVSSIGPRAPDHNAKYYNGRASRPGEVHTSSGHDGTTHAITPIGRDEAAAGPRKALMFDMGFLVPRQRLRVVWLVCRGPFSEVLLRTGYFRKTTMFFVGWSHEARCPSMQRDAAYRVGKQSIDDRYGSSSGSAP